MFSSLHVGSAMAKVLFNTVVYQLVGAQQNTVELEEGERFLDRFLPIVDTQLGREAFLANGSVSVADHLLLAWLDPAELSGVDLSVYPHIGRWRSGLKSESFYTQCHRDYAEMFEALTANMPQPDIDARSATG